MEDIAAALDAERRRLERRPADAGGIPELAFLDVRPSVEPGEWDRRLRGVLEAALGLALTASFDEELPTDGVPAWFLRVSDGGGPEEPGVEAFAAAGRARYLAHPGTNGPWEAQDWLSRFDLETGMRGWAFWDVTAPVPGLLRLWVDSGTEAFFAHLDLLWLAYTAGAREVSPPRPADSAAWAAEVS